MMKLFRFLWLFCCCSFLAEAATYNLPSSSPAGCTASGQIVTCGSGLSLNWDDIVNVTGNVILNITGNASLQNARMNLSGSPSALTINVTANLQTSSSFWANVNFSVGGSFNSGSGSTVIGNVNAASIQTSSNSSFTGNLTATNSLNTSSGNVIVGNLQAVTLTTGSGNSITGHLVATTLTTGSGNIIQGNLTATDIEIRSSNTQITGNVTASDNLFVGSGASINGNVSANAVDTNSPVTITGSIVAVESIEIASNSTINGPITAPEVILNPGSVSVYGAITATESLTVGSGGLVVGTVTAGDVILQNGNGTIEGDVDAEGDVSVGYGGQIIGNITAENVINNGTIDGNVQAEDTVTNGYNGQITGDVQAETIDNDGEIGGGSSCDESTGSNAPECQAAGPDHYRFNYSTDALTCNLTSVTIKACLNSDCSQSYLNPVSLTLSATGASWFGGNTVNFTNSAVKNLQRTSAGSATFGISSPGGAILKCNGVTAASCAVTFADSGFVVQVADQVAGKSQTAVIKAVRKDNASKACVPSFQNTDKGIKLWSEYVDPGSSNRPASLFMAVDGQAIGQSEAQGQVTDLAFNNSGEASIDLTYPDAGQVMLHARYDGFGTDAGLVMTGSGQFVSRPAGLCVSTTASCTAGDSSCSAFAKAGEDFTLSITAKSWVQDGDTNFCDNPNGTPNFVLSDIALTHQLVAPAAGAEGSLSIDSYDHTATANGTVTVNQALSEVGVFQITATPSSYFGHSIAAAKSAHIGRITPAYFTATPDGIPVLDAFCNNFAYLGQSLSYVTEPQITLKAKNMSGGDIVNYNNSFVKFTSSQQVTNVNAIYAALAADIEPVSTRGTLDLTETTPTDGVFLLTLNNDGVTTKKPETVVLPYQSADIGLNLSLTSSLMQDSDGVCVKSSPLDTCMSVVFNSITLPELRYGRLRLAGGSVAEAPAFIGVRLYAEYWDGDQFKLNTADSCSAVNFNNLTVVASHTASGEANKHLVDGLNPDSSLQVFVSTGGDGSWPIFYTAPEWLKFDWKKESGGQPLVLEDPQSEVSVGRFRGNKRQIFWQEKLN